MRHRLFAVVQKYGERVDGRITAWGMAFEDHTEIVHAEKDSPPDKIDAA